jgi:hypothetical protein
MSAPKFALGRLMITPTARTTLAHEDVLAALSRHVRGDWGDCSPDDWAANEAALRKGARLFSVYHTASRTKFWLITEADRAYTTVLLPGDY